MKIAWIYPRNRRCGISVYAHKCLATLRSTEDIVEYDPCDFVHDRGAMVQALNFCDAVHLQYETSLYMRGRSDFFPGLCAAIRRPIIVSLHEVYHRFPGVYPREKIRGVYPLAALRRFMYDLRHPGPVALLRHERAGFYAQSVVVHGQWQRRILTQRGLRGEAIEVIPYPLSPAAAAAPQRPAPGMPLRLGSLGFITVNYDYGLLMEALAALRRPWTFIWIGGPRRAEDRPLQQRLEHEAQSRGWAERFRVTGWVDDSELDRLLAQIDVYCALFAARSSSESLAAAMSALRPIVATRLPLTEELNAPATLMALVCANAGSVAAAIERLADDVAYCQYLTANLRAHAASANFSTMALRLRKLYAETLRRHG